MKKVITICASVSHYRQIIPIEKELRALGYKVLMPDMLRVMKKSDNFNPDTYKTWFKNKNDYSKKTALIRNHFKKIFKSDAILVLNFQKNEIPGYIGGNVLMEMTLAFHYKKPIFILNEVSRELSYTEEIYGMKPKFINGDLGKIKL